MKTKIPVINKRGEIVYLDDDNDGVVPDGHGIRTSMFLMDSADEVQRAIATDSRAVVMDAWGNPAGNRPGYAFVQDYTAREDAREAYKARISDAWKTKPSTPVVTRDTRTATDAQATRDAAYAELVNRTANAWRTP